MARRALIALTDAEAAEKLAEHVAAQGFEPVLVANGAEALSKAREAWPDVAILSQLLTQKDGLEVCSELKFKDAKTPVILVAAVGSPAGIADVRKASKAEVVVSRNFRPEGLVREFDQLMGCTPAKAERAAPIAKIALVKRAEVIAPEAPEVLVPEPPAATWGNAALIPPPPPPAPASAPPRPQPVAPRTNLVAEPAIGNTPVEGFEPVAYLARLVLARTTGALRVVSRQGIERVVYLREGRPIAATSNLIGDRIGEILVRKALITEPELREALAYGRDNGVRLGQALVDLGMLTFERQRAEVAEQYVQRIVSMFWLTEASVELTERVPPDEAIPIEIPPQRILLEGLRRYYTAARLEEVLAPVDRVLRPSPAAAAAVATLGMNENEAAVLAQLDGKSIAEAVAASPSKIDALRAIHLLACVGLLS